MFGSDGSPIVQYVSIFAVIFAVLAAIVLAVRRLSGRGLGVAGRAGQRGRQPRLGIVDVYELDRQRQLILLRRDNVEHLLLVGGPNDVVIERNIQRGPRDPAFRPEAVTDPLADPLAASLADPLADPLGEPFANTPPALASAFPMPVVIGPAVPGSSAVPPVTRALDEIALDRTAVGAGAGAGEAPATEAVVSVPRPEGAVRRPMRRTPPPLINPRPDVASERPRSETPAEAAAPLVAPPAPMPPAAEPRTVDPAILADMARQLEAALARPASAVPPPPRQAGPDSKRLPVSAPEPAPPIDPIAAAMATPAAARPERSAAEDTLFEDTPPAESAAPPAAFRPEPPSAPKPEPDPAPSAVPAVSPSAGPAQPQKPDSSDPVARKAPDAKPPSPAPKSSANPFSVEEIEAEFARLLGRPLDKRN